MKNADYIIQTKFSEIADRYGADRCCVYMLDDDGMLDCTRALNVSCVYEKVISRKLTPQRPNRQHLPYSLIGIQLNVLEDLEVNCRMIYIEELRTFAPSLYSVMKERNDNFGELRMFLTASIHLYGHIAGFVSLEYYHEPMMLNMDSFSLDCYNAEFLLNKAVNLS